LSNEDATKANPIRVLQLLPWKEQGADEEAFERLLILP